MPNQALINLLKSYSIPTDENMKDFAEKNVYLKTSLFLVDESELTIEDALKLSIAFMLQENIQLHAQLNIHELAIKHYAETQPAHFIGFTKPTKVS